jgi:hypothetical protein
LTEKAIAKSRVDHKIICATANKMLDTTRFQGLGVILKEMKIAHHKHQTAQNVASIETKCLCLGTLALEIWLPRVAAKS